MVSDELLLLAAGSILLTVAAIHLVVGLITGYEWATIGTGSLVVAAMFVVYGIAGYSIVGLYSTASIGPRTSYLFAGVFLAIGFISYLEFHILQFTAGPLPLETIGVDHHHHHDHTHHHGHHTEPGVLENLANHLRDDFFALISRSLEVIGLVLLGVIYKRTPAEAIE